jgi:hypothetical protein
MRLPLRSPILFLVVMSALLPWVPGAMATDVAGTIATNTTWTPAGSPYVVTSDIIVAAGVKLTVQPGVTVQFQQHRALFVEGELEARGSSGSPIVFTGTTAAKGWWRYIYAFNAGKATLDWCRVSYAGFYDSAAILKTGSGALAVTNSVIDSTPGDGIRIAAGYAAFTSANNTFSNHNFGVRLTIGASFDDDSSDFSGNAVDVYVDGGGIPQDVTWNLKPAYSVYVSADLTVGAGRRLTVKPGTVVKFAQYKAIWVQGELIAQGSAGAPVVFTDWRDDTAGGDANGDGSATQPAPGWWRFIYVSGGGSATLAECRIAYAGYFDSAGIVKTGSGALSMNGVTVTDTAGDGLRIDGSSGAHGIVYCRFENNTNGVLVRNQTGTITLTASAMQGNATYGVLNQGTIDVDARSCTWGHASGPYHPTLNPTGMGDPVSDKVLFEPWKESLDRDDDGLPDYIEDGVPGLSADDADSDDDGLLDGEEDINRNGVVDPGETDPCNKDTDNDGIQDGTESGLTSGHSTDTDPAVFQPDQDGGSTTDPLNPDSDGDGFRDGDEDTDRNGRADPGEDDPESACLNDPVRIPAAVPAYFESIQEGYQAAMDGDTLEMLGRMFYEDLMFDLGIAVFLRSGYRCDYSPNAKGVTTARGRMTIAGGCVVLERACFQLGPPR